MALRTLSTDWTILFRLLACPLGALAVVIGLHAVREGFRWEDIGGYLAAWGVNLPLAWFLARLKTVKADDVNLYVRGILRRDTIPYHQVARVRVLRPGCAMAFVVVPLVTVVLKEDSAVGRKFRFYPRATLKGWRGGVHPDVAFLLEKTESPSTASEERQ